MKKMLLALLVLAFAAASASAGVNLSWAMSYGAYDHTAVDLAGDDGAILDSYSVTWQLIYAGANNAIDAIDLGNSGGGWVSGDDVVWASRSIAQNGTATEWDIVNGARANTYWTSYLEYDTGGSIVFQDPDFNTANRFVFQRLFEGTPQMLSWYYESALEPLNAGWDAIAEPTAMPQPFNLGTGDEGIQPDQQFAIPEPATMSLLGLGALVMAFRRRRS